MVVMITPVSFSSIGYKTYIIFAVINAFIFPVVYFFYPETAYRSLEEIDSIFRGTKKGWRGWFDVVRVATEMPLRYGKQGELLIEYHGEGDGEGLKEGQGEGTVENVGRESGSLREEKV